MDSAFLVWHTYSEGGDDDAEINAKLLGAFSTREKADERVAAALGEDGFRDWPEGFIVDEYKIHQATWVGGFVRDV